MSLLFMRVSKRAFRLVLILAAIIGFAIWGWFWYQKPSLAVFTRALEAVEKRDFASVAVAAQKLKRSPEFRHHASLLRGIVLLDGGEPAKALREFSSARPTGPIRLPLLQYTAQALYRTGEIFEAARLFIILLGEDPNNAEGHRWLGAVYYDLGNQTEAIVELTEAARLKPDDHRPHRLLGLICTDQSMFGLAVEHYRTALKLGKDIPQPDIVQDLATILIQRNRFSEALEALEQGEPTASVWALRAECHDGLGQPDLSKEAVSKALLADANNDKALRLHGTRLLADGNAAEAIEPLKKVLQYDPHDTRARYQLSMAYSRLGQDETSKLEMQSHDASVKLHEQFYAFAKQAAGEPGNFKIREQLATIATTLGKPEVAQRWKLAAIACRNAVSTAPENDFPKP